MNKKPPASVRPSSSAKPNHLYYGDNLDVLRNHIRDESVDLVYLDPPFNSNANYNVLFKEHNGTKSAAQIQAFGDTWEWNTEAEFSYQEMVERGGRISDVMRALRTFLGSSDMMAYLSMMAPRLVEMHRVLKPTGSIYLHCDLTASHYLKLLMDAIFGPEQFRSDIVWKRTSSHSNASRRYGTVSDQLLFYVKSDAHKFKVQYVDYSEQYVKGFYRHVDGNGRRYRISDLRNPSVRPNLQYVYKGYKPHPNGWAVCLEKMEKYDREGRLHFPKSKDGRIQLRRYLDEMPGMQVSNVWDDIPAIHAQAAERMGYPTQKPQQLLERLIEASTDEGDVVLDCFCGCGTAIEAAEKLKRRWIGIDITHLAIGLVKHRLHSAFGDDIVNSYDVTGEPVTVEEAAQLAKDDPYQFQFWALGLVGARSADAKKGADRGIDGKLFFHDDTSGQTKQIVLSVKGGERLTPMFVRDLRGVVAREKAELGVLITLVEPTREMVKDAAASGFYESSWGKHPKVQILTVKQLLNGEGIDRPPTREIDVTIKKRARSLVRPPAQQLTFEDAQPEGQKRKPPVAERPLVVRSGDRVRRT